MRRFLLMFAWLLTAFVAVAQESEVKLETNMEYGKALEFSIEMVEGSTVRIDWGDGTIKDHQTQTAWGTTARISGKSYGAPIHIYGALKSLEAPNDSVKSLQLVSQSELKRLDLSNNQLTYDALDLSGAPNLVNLNLDNNKIAMLNLMAFEKLEIFSVNNNPDFTTAVFADNNALTNISMANCDVVHFYPVSMPNLRYLIIDNGDLQELALDDNYPNLQKLSLKGNGSLQVLDIATLPNLEELNISNTGIADINTTRNPHLTHLYAAHTNLRNLSLAYNPSIQSLNVSNTGISKLDVSKLSRLRNIIIDSTDIARLDLTGKIYLKTVSARHTNIEFLDMHDEVGYNSLSMLDLRDNLSMTPQTLNFTFQMMPYHQGSSWSKNVLIEGIPGAETSNTDLITEDAENFYKVDVQGDGTAPMNPVAITLKNVEGGSVALTQIQNDYTWTAISTEAKPGYPISVAATPLEGYRFAGVRVNGNLYQDTIFVTSVAAKVEPVFIASANEQVIKLTVAPGALQQYFLSGKSVSNEVFVDWGDGQQVSYSIGNTPTAITNEVGTSGSTVTITGPITHADFSSYPGFGTDNEITAIDVTKAPNLRSFSAYFNSIESIDVRNNKELESLDVAYTDISKLDISQNTKLKELRAYNNELSELNISTAPDLTYLDVKNNNLTELNTDNSRKLQTLIVMGNKLSTLNVSAMTDLVELDFSDNNIESINVANAPELKKLGASKNKLTSLDLAANTKLQTLLVGDNQLEGLDLSNQKMLTLVNVANNGWDACTLNDLYYSLNEYPQLQESGYATGNTLLVTDSESEHPNDATHAESDIAKTKGWAINTEGDGTGCSLAYITVIGTENGSVTLKDADGNEIKSGDKVQKNSVVTLEATPAAGYSVSSSKANGMDILNNQFTVTKATDVAVKFVLATGIDGVEGSATLTVTPAEGSVVIATDKATPVSIFATNGVNVFEGTVYGTQTVQLNNGVYVVKVGDVRKTVFVK